MPNKQFVVSTRVNLRSKRKLMTTSRSTGMKEADLIRLALSSFFENYSKPEDILALHISSRASR